MAPKGRSSRAPDAEFFGSLLNYLHARRDAGDCPTPVTAATIAALLDHALAPRETQTVRDHLAACVFCLNAYAEQRAAHETKIAVPRPEIARPAPTVAAPSDLSERVRAWREAVSHAIRGFQHRAVQRSYSEPSLSMGLMMDRGLIDQMALRRFRTQGSGPSGDVVAQLDLVERALTERIETLTTLRQLARRAVGLWTEIRQVAMPRDARQELLEQLDRDSDALVDAVQHSVRTGARRSGGVARPPARRRR
jgi:hypothetical protein